MRLMPFVLVLFILAGAGTREPFFFLGVYAVLGWVLVAMFIRGVRWLGSPAGAGRGCGDWQARVEPPAPGRVGTHGQAAPSGRVRVCPDHRCGRVNVGHACFCAQCGRRLA